MGAIILMAAYFVGVALIGAGLAALAVNIVWSQISGGEPPALAIIVAAVARAARALSVSAT